VVDINEIVEKILIGYAGDVNDARAMVKRYLSLLASAGKTEDKFRGPPSTGSTLEGRT
jgi:20S proteasome alpha/beta subunit